jgi:GH43 family beta-xylosidase
MDCDGIEYPYINEGPCVYIKDGKLKVIYSASGSWANHYCMGILDFLGGDLLDATRWKKQPFPALSMEDGWNGPGHCSVTTDGQNDYIAFHTYDEGKSQGWSFVHAVICPFEIISGKIVIIDDPLN